MTPKKNQIHFLFSLISEKKIEESFTKNNPGFRMVHELLILNTIYFSPEERNRSLCRKISKE
jgi:hypothetical protein